MQYTSRLYIKFKDKSKWEFFLKEFKFTSGNETHSMYDFIEDFFSSFQFFANGVNISEEALDCNIGATYDGDNLEALVGMIHSKIKDDAIILADSYCYSNDPAFCYELYSIGGELHTYWRDRGAEKHFNLSISDIKAWLGPSRTKTLSVEEKVFLKQF